MPSTPNPETAEEKKIEEERNEEKMTRTSSTPSPGTERPRRRPEAARARATRRRRRPRRTARRNEASESSSSSGNPPPHENARHARPPFSLAHPSPRGEGEQEAVETPSILTRRLATHDTRPPPPASTHTHTHADTSVRKPPTPSSARSFPTDRHALATIARQRIHGLGAPLASFEQYEWYASTERFA